jgi:peroxiredoxin/DNA-binding XRE family transcriptional regulator
VARSADFLSRGPLIVSFFRGPWCPHCNEELADLAEAYQEIREAGAEVVAVTPQSAADERTYGDKHPVPFPILVDADFSVAFSFGVVYTVPEYLREFHKTAFPSDVMQGKAGNSWRRPIPARFVIATDGRIVDAQADTDRRADDAVVRAFTSLEAAWSSTVQNHAQGNEDERARDFGDFLRRCRQEIPVETKALGTFVRLPNRVGKAVSQEELAEAIGVSRSWYGLLETGRPVQPSVALLDRISDVLMLHERMRSALFELGLPAFWRRAVELGRRAVLEAPVRTGVASRAS